MTALDTQIKGFKHLRPGAECAILRVERFGRGRSYRLGTIKRFDVMKGEIEVDGAWQTFGMDGYELGGTGGEPRLRIIVPIPDEVRAEVWRNESRDRIQTLLHNWKKLDDNLIMALMETIDQWYEKKEVPPPGIEPRHSV